MTYEGDFLRALDGSVRGEVIWPDDVEFEAARGVWNADFDRRPAVIVRAADAGDVGTAVKFASERGLTISVRSGGHSMVGYGTNDGGLVIDLSAMNGMSVDPERKVARIEPGRTWGEVAEEAAKYGLALSSGDMASVGVGGLTVGGGIGWMVRKYGLTIDHLISADVVTADGELVHASADENAELFWALRGGGGNFGIVTSFEFGLHPGGLIVGGGVIYEVEHAYDILHEYSRYAMGAPHELTSMATIMHAPPAPFIPPHLQNKPVLIVLVCYTGDVEEGQRVVAPLRTLAEPVADLISPMPYGAMFELTKEGSRRGMSHATRSMFLEKVDDEALKTIVEQIPTMGAPLAMAQLRILGGAMSRVPEDETAFAHRDKAAMLTINSSWIDPAERDERHAWTERFWQAMRPYASGVYVNFLSEEGQERIREAYKPATYARLEALKLRYDPSNLFRLNQNINPPAGESESWRAA